MSEKLFRRFTARVLSIALVMGLLIPVVPGKTADAAAKLKLSKKKITLKVGESKKISIKKAKKLKITKVKWKINKKKIAGFKKKGRFAVKVTAKKKGKAVLKCRVKIKGKWKSAKCTVKVKKKGGSDPSDKTGKNSPSPDAAMSAKPSGTPVTSGQPGGTSAQPSSGQPQGSPAAQTSSSPAAQTSSSPAAQTSPSPAAQASPSPAGKPSSSPAGKPSPAPSAEPSFEPVEYKTAGFESGTDGFVPRGGKVELSTVEGGHTGKCLKVTGREDTWQGAAFDVTDTIVKGAEYKFSAWVRQDSGADSAIKLSCEMKAGSDTTWPAIKELTCKSGEWTLLEGTYTVPDDFDSLSIYFEGPDGTYDIFVDDVSIEQVSKPGFVPTVYKKAEFESGTDGFVARGSAELSSVAGGRTGNCLKASNRGDTWHGAELDVTDTIAKGADYSFSAWVRQDSGADAAIKLSCTLNTGGSDTWPAIKEVTCKSGEWTLIEGTYSVPKNFVKLTVYFEGPGGKYDIFVDDLVIKQETEGAPVFDPSSLGSLKEAYAGEFTYFGTCLGYNTVWNNGTQLQDDRMMQFVQKQFSSFTLENEMKADQILSSYAGKISVSEAKNLGYVIPSSYKESTVPRLNFDNVDKAMEKAKQYGLKMRAHAPLWHQQTSNTFFKEGYSSDGALVSKTVMDARNEFYIKTVMKHVMEKEKALTGGVGNIIYCWDVVNEYIHRKNDPNKPSWMDIYGDMELEPTYVKNAFRHAYSMLKEYSAQNKVTLFYNDYNEYDCADDIVALVTYINSGEGNNICGGIGMQSHITTQYPSLEKYGQALDKFLATGLEVHVTELDIGIAEEDDEEVQAQVYADLLKLVMQKNKNKTSGQKGITGVTIWGMLDVDSWRKESKPILFGTDIDDPKPCFYSLLEAAKG